MWNNGRRLSSMKCLKISFPGSLRSHLHGVQLPVKAQVRCIFQGVSRIDSSLRPARSLSSRSVLSVPALYLQPCSVRCMSGSGFRPGWYESVADSAPIHFTEQLLISSQQMTALPWWAGIICTTLALRTVVTLPLAVYQAAIIAKIEALQKEIAELAQQLSYEISIRAKEKGWSEKTCRYHFKKNLRRIVSELYVRDNCHPFKATLLVWVQLPMWVSVSLALRNISVGLDHVPSVRVFVFVHVRLQQELAAGGAFWFPDLTVPDSTWIIPVSLGLINLLITEVYALSKLEQSKFQKYVTNFIRGISLFMIPLAATVPSSMALYWLSSSCIGLAHNLLLRSPRFRSLCRIPPSRSDSHTPYRDIAAAFVVRRAAGTGCAFRVMDACGCCELCAAGAGEPCGARGSVVTRCAPGFECVKPRQDKKTAKRKSEPGVCMCKNGDYRVCGSDDVEYRSVCELRAANASTERQNKPGIKVQNKGKCAKAPVIVTAPGEVWNVTGAQVFLSCEAIGVPTPMLSWRKITDDNQKSQLPPRRPEQPRHPGERRPREARGHRMGADTDLCVFQIFPLTMEVAGRYECHASNAKGEASATGAIHVVDSIADIPTRKGEGAGFH
ncbi:hypothetical protein QTP70_014511 [Hemibagrus guttatus]|uniref:Mitochondrial inner membrane protein COX18 n=1 Tax=Hemibagrus guttatus TaxID=175788 RepID=A0AAE0QEH1_9TELE|nr:hypothetical protein QTP70_014511 [Hemibagrus guttatus]